MRRVHAHWHREVCRGSALLCARRQQPEASCVAHGLVGQHHVDMVVVEVVKVGRKARRHRVQCEVQLHYRVAAVLVLQAHRVGVVVFRVGVSVVPRQRSAVVVHLRCVADVVDRQVEMHHAVACVPCRQRHPRGLRALGVFLPVEVPCQALALADVVALRGVEGRVDEEHQGVVVGASADEVDDGPEVDGVHVVVANGVGSRQRRQAQQASVVHQLVGRLGQLGARSVHHPPGFPFHPLGVLYVCVFRPHVACLPAADVEATCVARMAAAAQRLQLQRVDGVDAYRDGVVEVIPVAVGVHEAQFAHISRCAARTHQRLCQRRMLIVVSHRHIVAVGVQRVGAQRYRVAVGHQAEPIACLARRTHRREAVGRAVELGVEHVFPFRPESGIRARDHEIVRRESVGRHLRLACGVLYADDAHAVLPVGVHAAVFDVHLYDVRPFVAHYLVCAPVVKVAAAGVGRYAVPRADDFAAGELVLYAVVDALRPAQVAADGVCVFVDAVDGIAHTRQRHVAAALVVGARSAAFAVGPRQTRRECIRACVAAAELAGGKRDHPVGSQAESVFADAEEVERVGDGRGGGRKVVVGRNRHLCALRKAGVGWSIRYLVHLIGAVEVLHRYVWFGIQLDGPLRTRHRSVPSLRLILRIDHMVVFLHDSYLRTRARIALRARAHKHAHDRNGRGYQSLEVSFF